jgi:apolipoprotein N-acyltransferase
MDFTPLSREYGRKGVGLMLVPGWDFNMDRWWHGHIAVMRGVEDGFSVVRAAKNGYLTVSDDRGRILAETRSDSAAFVTLLSAVPAAHNRTVYLFLGDWFAWVSVTLLVFCDIARSQEVATKLGLRPKYPALANSQLFTSFHSCLTPTLFRRTMFMPG